ncbi:aerolysin-like protein [Silurus meridionalis]|nr:aerolysin-like protein [Silurus meridionalis]
MSSLADVLIIGGQGGDPFDFNGIGNGATITKIWVWAGGWQIKAIKVWLNDGQSKQFGRENGKFSEFIFEDGEHFTSLSLWGNGAGTRLGAIRFTTNRSRVFFPKMTSWELKTEYPVDVGSGICLGIMGRSGSDVDSLGFIFINTIRYTELTGVTYPTLHDETPIVAVDEIKSMTYQNNTTEVLKYTFDTATKITKKSSWSVTNKTESSFCIEVKAGIPNILEISGGFSYTMGTERSYTLEFTEEKTESFSFTITVPPGKTVDAIVTIGWANIDLPYTGTVKITCVNGSVLQFPTSGTYKGINYTKAKIVVNESTKMLAADPKAENEVTYKTF